MWRAWGDEGARCRGKHRGRRISPQTAARATDSGLKASPLQGPAAAESGACRGRGRGRRSPPQNAPRERPSPTKCIKGDTFRHETHQGRRHALPLRVFVTACHERCRGRRISPRMGARATDSALKASPLQGPAAAEGGMCRGRRRGRRSPPQNAPRERPSPTKCIKGDTFPHEMYQGRERTPREAARGTRHPGFPGGIFSLAGLRGSRSACASPSGGFAAPGAPGCHGSARG